MLTYLEWIVCFAIIVIFWFIFKKFGVFRKSSLIKTGKLINGKILYIIEQIKSGNTPGASGLGWTNYKLYCQAVDQPELKDQIFISNPLLNEPVLDLKQNDHIIIYIDNKNKENYYVDLSKIQTKKPATRGDGFYKSIDGKNYEFVNNPGMDAAKLFYQSLKDKFSQK